MHHRNGGARAATAAITTLKNHTDDIEDDQEARLERRTIRISAADNPGSCLEGSQRRVGVS